MYSFSCDYLEGCHPEILKALIATNMEQETGYGEDRFSKSAREKIRRACETEDADIYFVNGGTQTNQLIIDTMLKNYEGVLAAESGHISVHEAGAIEFSGHKVLTLPSHHGKVDISEVAQYIQNFYEDGNHEHMVFPAMLYISYPTEYGTLYTREELLLLSKLCKDHNIKFFIDGARLGYGLMANDGSVTLPFIASICDVFYIGGTKIGALCGEAIVFPRGNTPSHFVTQIKQHGALSAKGRLYGIQFDVLFTDDLYLKIAKHGIDAAMRIKKIFQDAGAKFYLDSPSNQQFIIVDNVLMQKLAEKVTFGFWEKYDTNHTVIRFATSWASTEEGIQALVEVVNELF